MKKKNKIKVVWKDAIVYSSKDKLPTSLPLMETVGFLEKENKTFVIIKDPHTINLKKNTLHPRGNKPTFYYIPKGMIQKIEVQ